VLPLVVGIALLGVVTPAVAGQKSGAGGGAPKPDGKFQLITSSIASGQGVSWADGSLSAKSQNYKFRVEAHTMTDSEVLNNLAGEQITYDGLVYNLKNVSDFAGTYTRVKPEVAQALGVTNAAVFQNEKGVVLRVTGRQKVYGLHLRLLGDGFKLAMRDF